MDIYRQVFVRSVRMGISYVILSVIIGLLMTVTFDVVVRFGSAVPASPVVGNIRDILGLMVVPFAAVVGLLITTPVYLLFVNDKNVGVLEYFLAVGMSQRNIFWGYLKASFILSLVAMVPMILLNLVLAGSGIATSIAVSGIGLVTGLADVALVTVMMTAFSSMQRRPTGMNSPVGITVGIFLLLPEFIVIGLLKAAIIWFDLAVALAILGTAVILLLSIDRLIVREKLLP